MATTAKIAKDIKLEKARKAKTPKLQCRHRNRCWRCGRPRAFSAQVRDLPPVFPPVGVERRDPRRDQGELVGPVGNRAGEL